MHPNNRAVVVIGVIVAILAIGIGGFMFYTKKSDVDVQENAQTTSGTSNFPHTKTADGARRHTEEKTGYQVDVTYPDSVGITASAGSSGETIALRDMEQYVEKTVEDFKKEVAGQPGYQKVLEMGYKRFESTNTVSFVFTVSTDTGGAHPISYFKTFVWSKKGGMLKLSDILKGNYLSRLSSVSKAQVTENIQKMIGEGGEVSLFEEGFAASSENFQNFYLDGTELVILFDPYQVAAYAAGAQEVHIKLQDIKEFVRPDFISG